MTKKGSSCPPRAGIISWRGRWLGALALAIGLGGAPMLAGALEAQTGTITGRVVSQSGVGISNVSISLVGTARGTISDSRGVFTLQNVPAGEQQISAGSIGYRTETRTVTVQAGQVAQVEFVLQTSAVALDELVVTGQATGVARREIGTSIASVDVNRLQDAPINNLSQLLQARAPGVNVLPGGGKSGQGSRIVLRGAASISQNNEPLIYVDGIRIDNSSASGVTTVTAGASWSGLDDINPADIERVEIIRGASAATLYGSEASAGVIQIFTRRGREGRTQWRYSADFGSLSTPFEWWDISAYSRWFYDTMVQRGSTQTHQLSATGGGENFSYYAAVSARDESGILPNGGEEAYSGRLNLTVIPTSNFTVRFNSSFTRRTVFHTPDANNTRGYTINGLVGGPAGQFVDTESLTAIEAQQAGNRFTGGVTVEHQIRPDLSHRVTFGADIMNSDEYEFFPFGAISNIVQGYRSNYRRQNLNYNIDYSATFRTQITSGVRSTTSAGFQYFDRNTSSSTATGDGFPFIGLETVGSALSRTGSEGRIAERSAGFFAEQQFGFNDLVFFTVGARADAHSAFGEDVEYQVYPKADVSYVISQHGFLPEMVSTMRLRAAYGTAGNQPTNFAAVRTWIPTAGVGGQPAVVPGNLGNPDLKAEVSTEIELGFDAGFFDDRLRVEVTRYDQRTKDALYEVREPPSEGFLNTQLRNVGEIENKGWEAGVSGQVLDTYLAGRAFGWDAMVNVSRNSNKIISLGGGAPIQLQWLQWMREGYPVGAFFGDRFIEVNGQVGLASELLRDANGELPEGWDYLGEPLPTRTYQFGSTFSFADRWGLSLLVDHKGGHMNHDHSMRWLMHPARQVTGDGQGVATPGPVANVCRDDQSPVTQAVCGRPTALTHGDFAYAADITRLREVTLTFRAPDAWFERMGIQSATFSLAGRNLFRWTDYPGLDPEGMYRNDLSDSALRAHNFFDTPLPRQIVFGINATF